MGGLAISAIALFGGFWLAFNANGASEAFFRLAHR